MSRTTLTLDSDAMQLARAYARAHSLRLGQAVSLLVRRGAGAGSGVRARKAGTLVVFDLPSGAKRVGVEDVQHALESE